MVTDTIKAAYLEELRFAKRQQWTITAAVVAFIAGAYTLARDLAPSEKCATAVLIWIVVAGGIYWLFDLQGHLHRTRLVIDRWDSTSWWRSTDVVSGMVGILIISATGVCYLLSECVLSAHCLYPYFCERLGLSSCARCPCPSR